MGRKLANYGLSVNSPGKNAGQAKNDVNSVANRVAHSFEAAEDHLMSKNHALNKGDLAYTSDIENRLG